MNISINLIIGYKIDLEGDFEDLFISEESRDDSLDSGIETAGCDGGFVIGEATSFGAHDIGEPIELSVSHLTSLLSREEEIKETISKFVKPEVMKLISEAKISTYAYEF